MLHTICCAGIVLLGLGGCRPVLATEPEGTVSDIWNRFEMPGRRYLVGVGFSQGG